MKKPIKYSATVEEASLAFLKAMTKTVECKHYDREEINIVLDGKTPPIVRCKDCGATLVTEKKTEG